MPRVSMSTMMLVVALLASCYGITSAMDGAPLSFVPAQSAAIRTRERLRPRRIVCMVMTTSVTASVLGVVVSRRHVKVLRISLLEMRRGDSHTVRPAIDGCALLGVFPSVGERWVALGSRRVALPAQRAPSQGTHAVRSTMQRRRRDVRMRQQRTRVCLASEP